MYRLLPLTLLALLACGDDDRRPDDVGLGLVDSGPAPDAGPVGCEEPYPDLIPISMANPAEMILPRCNAATATCVSECADNACADACLANDTLPPLVDPSGMLNCDDCVALQTLACFENFCAPQFAAVRCCLDANSCDDLDCAACTAEATAYRTCVGGDTVMCGDFIVPCFAAP